jgi:OPA family glycerol-3-phosphate transporter-like MFS transporter
MEQARPTGRLLRWQLLTVGLLVMGYSGYYLCRSNLSVSMPLILDDLKARGMDPDQAKLSLGMVVSLGTLAYAIGKFVSGAIGDFLGGRRNFLAGMVASTFFTLLFALGGILPIFTLAWIANRLVQSLGWVGMVKIAGRWFSYSSYGTVMAIISLSFLFGDAAAREFMSRLIEWGCGWQGVFFAAAGTLFVLFLVNLFLLRETPQDIGEVEPQTNPQNLFGNQGEQPAPANLRALLRPFLTSPAFWFVCLLSLGLTLVRETFLTWTPTYFHEVAGFTEAQAAENSAYFPLMGGVSVLVSGFLSDRLGRGGRAGVILAGLLATGGALALLAGGDFGGSRQAPVALTALIALLMMGPYAYLAGAIALDFGGKQGSATACGIIDGVGYLGGILAGDAIARITVHFGWTGAFAVLAGVAWVSCVPAYLLLIDQLRRPIRLEEKTP